MHPIWYIKYYDKIFSRNYNSVSEFYNIIGMHSIKNKHVLEIGAGNGEQTELIINENVNELVIVDIDPKAVELLVEKFSKKSNIKIILDDGFNFHYSSKFDVVFCTYSIIINNIFSKDEILLRLNNIKNLLVNEGVAFIEIIDCEKSKSLYPQNVKNRLFKDVHITVDIQTIYYPQHIEIIYSGSIENDEIGYVVKLFSITNKSFSELLLEAGFIIIGKTNPENNERRIVYCVSKISGN